MNDPHELTDGGMESVDWHSFFNFEYDPSTTVGAAPSHEVITGETGSGMLPSPASNKDIQTNKDQTAATETRCFLDSSIGAALPDLTVKDEWWFGLPTGAELEQWDLIESGLSCEEAPQPDSSNTSVHLISPLPELDEGSVRKRRRRLSPKSKNRLTECFECHKEDPYVPKEEIQKLAIDTGLSIRQIQTFFANSRARKLPRVSSEKAGVQIPTPPREQGPMERFLSTSPEEDGISENAVKKAAKIMKRPIKPRCRAGRVSASVCDSTPSSTSNSSSASVDSLDSRGSRKGRKRRREPGRVVAKNVFRRPASPTKKFQCTFCTIDFGTKYDWKRHEESVHFPQNEWVCMPLGPIEDSRCVFCSEVSPDKSHLDRHKIAGCLEAPQEERAFQRKDKLVQHIKQVHTCPPPEAIRGWCIPVQRNVLLLCGMCSVILPDWKSRADHIATHFLSGVQMDMWLPDLFGGIWPNDQTTIDFIANRFSATHNSQGSVFCETCPAKFKDSRAAILHRRQAHGIFLIGDRTAVTGKPSEQPPPQRLIHIAQQMSRIQIARVQLTRVDALSGRSAPFNPHPNYQPVDLQGTKQSEALLYLNALNADPGSARILSTKPEQRRVMSVAQEMHPTLLRNSQMAFERSPVKKPFIKRSSALRNATAPEVSAGKYNGSSVMSMPTVNSMATMMQPSSMLESNPTTEVTQNSQMPYVHSSSATGLIPGTVSPSELFGDPDTALWAPMQALPPQ